MLLRLGVGAGSVASDFASLLFLRHDRRPCMPRTSRSVTARAGTSVASRRRMSTNNGYSTSSSPWLGRGFGLLSIGLGASEVLAPKRLAHLIGAKSAGTTLLRALGIRELATGLMLLAMPRRAKPLWARVVGDAIDLGVIGWMASRRRSNRKRMAIAAGVIAGVTVLDVLASRHASQAESQH